MNFRLVSVIIYSNSEQGWDFQIMHSGYKQFSPVHQCKLKIFYYSSFDIKSSIKTLQYAKQWNIAISGQFCAKSINKMPVTLIHHLCLWAA